MIPHAYIKGFVKTAKHYGVDPKKLIKVAVPLKQLLETARATGEVSPQLAKALANIGAVKPSLFRKLNGRWITVTGRKDLPFLKGGISNLEHIVGKHHSGIERAKKALEEHYKVVGDKVLKGTTPETKTVASLLNDFSSFNPTTGWTVSRGAKSTFPAGLVKQRPIFFGPTGTFAHSTYYDIPQKKLRELLGLRKPMQPSIVATNPGPLGSFLNDRVPAMNYMENLLKNMRG